MNLDHLILEVDDVQKSLDFYSKIFGFTDGGPDGPFRLMRINADAIVVLAPRRTPSTHHLAFALERAEFDTVLERMRAENVPYGDAFDRVGNNQGPAVETGAHGKSKSIYLFDPDQHLLEILYYE
jgi:catechol 2,3-dioxygenase-like lactoylglutathione lyase family enzyme